MMQTAEKLAEEEPWDVALGSRIYSGIMLMHVQGRRTALAHHYLRKANAAGIYITAASLQVLRCPPARTHARSATRRPHACSAACAAGRAGVCTYSVASA